MISFRDQVEATRAEALFSRLLWLDGVSTARLSRRRKKLSTEDSETLLSVVSEMLGLLDNLPSAAESLLRIFHENNGAFDKSLKKLPSILKGFEGYRLALNGLIIGFEKAGGFERLVVRSADTLLKRCEELREDLKQKQKDLVDMGVAEPDFGRWATCAFYISAAGCAGTVAIASVLGGPVAPLTGVLAAGAFCNYAASANKEGCFSRTHFHI